MLKIIKEKTQFFTKISKFPVSRTLISQFSFKPLLENL